MAHMHGNALTCSIQSIVEGSPSCTAHVWHTYSSHVAQVQLMCGSHVAHMHSNALTCSMVCYIYFVFIISS